MVEPVRDGVSARMSRAWMPGPRESAGSQGRRILVPLGIVVLSTAALVGGIAVAARAAGLEFSNFSRDAAEILRSPFYLGSLSMVGVLIWWGSAVICWFAASRRDLALRPERNTFLFVSGVVAGWLTLDDLFLLHDIVFPRHLGIRQRYIILAYAAGMCIYLWRFRKEILTTEYLLLGTSLAAFGVSVMADAAQTRLQLPGHHLVEDGAKLLGIAVWTLYFVRTARPAPVGDPGTTGVP